MKCKREWVMTAILLLSIVVIAYPANAMYPTAVIKAPAMDPSHQHAGSVSGRVTTMNTSQGIANASVAIVNASNTSEAYYTGVADANGYYQFAPVNNTIVGSSSTMAYRVLANRSGVGEGLSNAFGVEESLTTTVNVIIPVILSPSKIELTSWRNNIMPDDSDHVILSACVTDILGNPVADGTRIDFLVNQNPWTARVNGSLSLDGKYAPIQALYNVETKNGLANVTFGWVNRTYAWNAASIIASYSGDHSINASKEIYFNPVLNPDGEMYWGSVCFDNGTPVREVLPVTIHVMGKFENGTVFEIASAKDWTAKEQPYPGSYKGFVNNVSYNSASFVYISTEMDIGDGVIVRGVTDNITYNRSKSTFAGVIALHVPLPDAVTLSRAPDTILTGGNQSVITAQLYLNGRPYKKSGVTVRFSSDNDTVGYLPATTQHLSDANGQAATILTAGENPGDVNVSVQAIINMTYRLRDSDVIHVVDKVHMNSTGIAGNSTVNGSNIDNSSSVNQSIETVTPTGNTVAQNRYVLIMAFLVFALVAVAGTAVYMLTSKKKMGK